MTDVSDEEVSAASDVHIDTPDGDEPDTFDGRLEGISRLIDTLRDEINIDRRLQRRATILRLLDGLLDLARERVTEQRERIDQ